MNAHSTLILCASTIWSPITSTIKTLQNYKLYHTQHFALQMGTHLIFNICMTKQTYYHSTHNWNFVHHKSRQKSQHLTQPFHSLTKHISPRQKKLHSTTTNTQQTSKDITLAHIKQNIKLINTTKVTPFLNTRKTNRLLEAMASSINPTEASLIKAQRCILAQNK